MDETPMQRRFIAKYQMDNKTIHIRIVDYLSGAPSQAEYSEGFLEVYSASNIDFYIISNEDQLQAMWIIDNYECCITGPLTLSEIKLMINSIEKG
jgi:hypothetical protein